MAGGAGLAGCLGEDDDYNIPRSLEDLGGDYEPQSPDAPAYSFETSKERFEAFLKASLAVYNRKLQDRGVPFDIYDPAHSEFKVETETGSEDPRHGVAYARIAPDKPDVSDLEAIQDVLSESDMETLHSFLKTGLKGLVAQTADQLEAYADEVPNVTYWMVDDDRRGAKLELDLKAADKFYETHEWYEPEVDELYGSDNWTDELEQFMEFEYRGLDGQA